MSDAELVAASEAEAGSRVAGAIARALDDARVSNTRGLWDRYERHLARLEKAPSVPSGTDGV